MSSSPMNIKVSFHARSNSFPSRSHPLTLNVEEQLCRLRSSGETSSSSLSSISNSLNGLNNMYATVEDLLQVTVTKQALSGEQSYKCINRVADGSLRLLDMCSTTRDILLQTKECVQELQSSLRRKGEQDLSNEVSIYMISRKKASKLIQKCLAESKKMETRHHNFSLSEDQNVVAVSCVLREVEMITLTTLKSVLLSVSSSRQKSESLVSKLMHTKKVACQVGEADILGMENIDIALRTLVRKNSSKTTGVQYAQKQLEAIEFTIQGIEDQLQMAYKNLIKTRVSLLNILSQ